MSATRKVRGERGRSERVTRLGKSSGRAIVGPPGRGGWGKCQRGGAEPSGHAQQSVPSADPVPPFPDRGLCQLSWSTPAVVFSWERNLARREKVRSCASAATGAGHHHLHPLYPSHPSTPKQHYAAIPLPGTPSSHPLSLRP